MPKIRAAVCHEFGKPLVLEEVMLREPAAGELEVTIRACAICHSDISAMDGDWGGHLPAVYGHEAAGVITVSVQMSRHTKLETQFLSLSSAHVAIVYLAIQENQPVVKLDMTLCLGL